MTACETFLDGKKKTDGVFMPHLASLKKFVRTIQSIKRKSTSKIIIFNFYVIRHSNVRQIEIKVLK